MRPERSERKELWRTEILLDSNVFLEAQLAERHGKACRQLLAKIRDGIVKATITDFHVDSVVVVMENYGKGWKEVALFLTSLLRCKGLKLYPLGIISRIRATTFMRDYGLDFDDALAVQALKDLSIDTIISYDDDFDAVKGVKRCVPEDIL